MNSRLIPAWRWQLTTRVITASALLSLLFASQVAPVQAEKAASVSGIVRLNPIACTPDNYELGSAGNPAGDDTPATATTIADGVPQSHSACPATDEDWVTFTLTGTSQVILETTPLNPGDTPFQDTEIRLYDSSVLSDPYATPFAYNDDKSPSTWFSYVQQCRGASLPAGTYYAKINERGGDNEITYKLSFAVASECPPVVTVYIGGTPLKQYWPKAGEEFRDWYPLDSGPVVVYSDTLPIVASIRDLWSDSTHGTSSIQVMGMPASLISTSYYFPAYNNVTLDDQIRFGNVGSSPTTVTVKIAGIVRGTYYLLPGTSQRVYYAGVDTGPVVVSSSGGVPIIASIRDSWETGGEWTSYSQLMGLPSSLLSSKYYFPAYNNVSLDDQIRFGNVGTKSTTVTVKIAGVVKGNYFLKPNQSKRVNYPGVDNGPVVISSSGSVKIIASIRDSWWDGTRWTSYSQLMGLPYSQLSTIYHFPSYENVGQLDGQLRFGNVGTAPTWVTVTIGGVVKGTYWLAASQSLRVQYAGLNTGPVRIESSGGVPIIASLRDSWWDGTVWTSYSQLMGLPNGQLSSAYYFPAYNNINLNDELRIAVP